MLNKTSSIHLLFLAGLMLATAGSQASGQVGNQYRHHQPDRQYQGHRSRDHQRREYDRRHHNRYRYYGHSPYFNYRPYAYRHDYRSYNYHPYRYRGHPGYGGYYRGHGGLSIRLY